MKDLATTVVFERRSAHEIVTASGSSFLAGMRFLPKPRREAIFAVYAFCRVVDDIADAPGAPSDKLAGLDRWSEELDRVYEGQPMTPLGAQLARAVARYDLPRREFELIVEGMRMDATPIVAPMSVDLERYVRRVAGAVGMLSMRIFGAWKGPPSHRFALSLSRGMQLTNILRDVNEDAARGRLYIPREVLEAAGVAADPARASRDPNLAEARRRLGAEARASFRAAAAEVPGHPRLRLMPALLMMGPYERLLRRMEADWTRPAPSRPGWLKVVDAAGCAARGVARG